MNKSVSLIGNGSRESIVDGNAEERVIDIQSHRVTISGFSCRNGDYGIYVSTSNITIADNNCSDNELNGIQLDGSEDSIISNNICNNNNAGIYVIAS